MVKLLLYCSLQKLMIVNYICKIGGCFLQNDNKRKGRDVAILSLFRAEITSIGLKTIDLHWAGGTAIIINCKLKIVECMVKVFIY